MSKHDSCTGCNHNYPQMNHTVIPICIRCKDYSNHTSNKKEKKMGMGKNCGDCVYSMLNNNEDPCDFCKAFDMFIDKKFKKEKKMIDSMAYLVIAEDSDINHTHEGHETLNQAKTEAHRLCLKENKQFDVYKLSRVGTMSMSKTPVDWVPFKKEAKK